MKLEGLINKQQANNSHCQAKHHTLKVNFLLPLQKEIEKIARPLS
ncbi:hypothetical protein SD77_3237 [Bacillus badius]|uniref:Ribose 5-phosphate isomerase B n=1 Tax=Bacillus badius TaxID=1455 RepID=A0ABR5AX92_BACBA|nr:hypothetical protein SD78_0167 [Bacillus badius]KIL79371.1 hypothetical protein SD77_3237 [Bacillus badius]